MASIVLGTVGASVGSMLLPGVGTDILGALGKKLGQNLDNKWGLSNETEGSSRLESFKVQDSSYGVSIPIIFGRDRVAGNVIWVSDLIETEHESGILSGKGGTLSSSSTTYTYSLNCAVALCAGEIGSIQTIWADSKIIYEDGKWSSGVVESASVYKGTMEQEVDPLLESWIGEGLVPAYRGLAYIVIEGLQISNFSNRLPNLTFEVLPKDPTGQPEFLGTADPDIYLPVLSNRNQGMPPIRIDGGALSARTMIVSGVSDVDGGSATAFVKEYDVTGEEPVLLTSVESESFTADDLGSCSWALADDERFVAMVFQDAGTAKTLSVVIYDSQLACFGTPYEVELTNSIERSVAWIDAQHFVVMDDNETSRGVRVFMRSGRDVIDRGFYDVWGSGSLTTTFQELHAQFIPYADGLINFVVDDRPDFSTLKARHISWNSNSLSVESAYTVLNNIDTGSGSSIQVYLFQSSDNEWTLFYGNSVDMRLVSFVPTKTEATITRPWQVIASSGVTKFDCHAPVLIGSHVVILQRPYLENYYRMSEIALGDEDFTLEKDAVLIEDYQKVGLNFSLASISSDRVLASVNSGTGDNLARLDIFKRRNTGDTLDTVVAQILQRSGYETGDYDVTALADIPVDGYVVSEQATGRAALENLQELQPFDLIETDTQLRAVLRGKGDEIALSENELGASDTEDLVPLLEETRAQEITLPIQVSVTYEDISRDYEVGAQKARRAILSGSSNVYTMSLPMVLTSSKAKQLAEEKLFTLWQERTAYRFYLSSSWLHLEPSDLISHDDRRMRITGIKYENGVMCVDAIASSETAVSSAASADSGSNDSKSMDAIIKSSLYIMDIPLLRAQDDEPGIYAAVSGLDGWPGGSLWSSPDGINYTEQASFTVPATAGGAVTQLAEAQTYYVDKKNVVQVQLLRGTLSSCTKEQMLNGSNVALLGAEIIQFQTATLIGPGLYELSGLLRGRRGTEGETSTHAIGESFVVLSTSTCQFLPAQISDRGISSYYKAVTNGGSLDLAQTIYRSNDLKTLCPLAPVHLKGVRDENGNLTLSWVRRARKNASWVDYIDVPLDEDEELYDLEIIDTASGEILRSVKDISESEFVYTAENQVEDLGSVSSTFRFSVYQKSTRYGRGLPAYKDI